MSFPSSPSNNQTAIVNGITYVYNASKTVWTRQQTAITASSGLDDHARTTANTATNNIIILQGVDTSQNTRLSVVEGGLISANANTVYLNTLITTNNTRISVIEGGLISANANSAYLQGALNTANTNINTKFNSSGGTITGSVTIAGNNDLIVTGNLIITGNVSSQNVQQLAVADPLLVLGIGNYVSDTKDIGFAAHYNDGSNAHAGIIRDSSTKEFYVFQGYTPEVDVTNNIDITNATFSTANINANYVKGNLIATTAVVGGVNLLDVNTTQNTRMSVIEGGLISANANTAYLNSLITTNNTRISSVNTTASAAYAKANTNISSDLTLTVTNSGSGAYVIGGASNPTVTLYRGVTYYFSINASGHPFFIQTVSGGYSSGNLYTSGVTGAGTQVGTVTFTVPLDAPSNLYYVCQFHSSMNGAFLIENLISTVNTQNTNITILQGVNTTQNTNITYGTNLAQAAYNQANTGGLVSNTGIITVDTFTGDGSTVAFTLSVTPVTKNYTSITIDGATQLKSAYSLSGNIITLSEAPLTGENIEVISFTNGVITSYDTVARDIANTATNNITILQNVNTSQNTRLSVVEGGLISANANTVYLNSLITTNNTRISVIEGGLITANANSAYLTSINTTQNTNITYATSLAQAAFDKANTGTTGGGTSNVTIVTSDSFVGNGSNVAFTLSTTPSSKDYTIITFDGAVQLRSSYSLTANTITFTEAPLNGENVEVTSFSNMPATTTVTINTFTGDGSTVAYTLSVSPSSKDYTFVNFDGTAQLRSSYSLSGNILTFTEAPLVGENIEVTSFTTNSTSSGTTIGKAIAMSIIFGG